MDENEFEYPVFQRSSKKLRWHNLAAVTLSGAGVILDGVSDTLEGLASLLMQHANYEEDRVAFHESAAVELESLLGGVDDDHTR